MEIRISQFRKLVFPLLFIISLCFNILFLLNLITFRINLFPSRDKELHIKTFKNFWDSPIVNPDSIIKNDSINRFKPKN
jgi:hypothetical protein